MQSANTVGFGSELVGLPIPVKYGYEFVGWKAMRVVEGENGESVLEPVQIEVDGNLVDAIVREGDTLNFNNCDVLNEWNELHFVAVFEAKEIELEVNFGADNFFTQNGISLNGKKENNINKIISELDLNNDFIIIKKGKKTFLKIIFL